MPKKGEYDPTKWGTYTCKYCGQEFKRRLCEVKFQQERGISKEPQFCCRDHMLKFNTESVQSIEFTCKQCGNKFSRLRRHVIAAKNKHEPILFCSRKCKDEYRKRDRQEVVCDQCGKHFKQYKPKIHKKNFCSQKCYRQYKQDEKIEFECPVCHMHFYRRRPYVERQLKRGQNVTYCSKSCAAFGNVLILEGIAKEDRKDFENFYRNSTCTHCGQHINFKTMQQAAKLYKQYKINKSKEIFCTDRCRKQYLKKNTSVNQICKYCDKVFIVTKAEFNRGKQFCSDKCRYKYAKTKEFSSPVLKLRKSKEYLNWRKKILNRDNFTCQECGSHTELHVHHIKSLTAICKEYENDYNKVLQSNEFNDIHNGITLCAKCHSKFHLWTRNKK